MSALFGFYSQAINAIKAIFRFPTAEAVGDYFKAGRTMFCPYKDL